MALALAEENMCHMLWSSKRSFGIVGNCHPKKKVPEGISGPSQAEQDHHPKLPKIEILLN
jgi:hypothetical protein